MNERVKELELYEADLLGYKPEDLVCVQCGGAFCGLRVGRVLDGKALIMCSRKDEVKEVLASIGRRQSG